MTTSENDTPSMNTPPSDLAPVFIVGGGLVMGFIGDILFYNYGQGINIPLYVGLGLTLLAALIYFFRPRLYIPNMLFAIPAIFCAVAMGLFISPALSFFNFCFALLSILIMVTFGREPRLLGGEWRVFVVGLIEISIGGILIIPILVLNSAAQWARTLTGDTPTNSRTAFAIMRGCLLALPIIIVFALLLGSADIVSGNFLEDVFSIFYFKDLEELIAHLSLIGVLAWLTIFTLGTLLHNHPLLRTREYPDLTQNFRLGFIEISIVLGSLTALFLFFVIIQAAYLFGGESNITSQGYTYAEYARRGFFELIAVSILTMGLIVGARLIAKVDTPRHEQTLQGLSIGLILMALIMLVSAYRRLSLYEDAYGYTHLRVVSHVFMIWLGLLFLILIADLLKVYPNLFWMGSVGVSVGFWMTLNIINLDAFIAKHNIERYTQTNKLDTVYLFSLSDDAVPAMIQLLDDEEMQARAKAELGYRLYQLDRYHAGRGVAGYHFSKERAWRLLDDRREELKEHVQPIRYFSQ